MKVRRRKNDESVSLAYSSAFFVPRGPRPPEGCGFVLGEGSIGITAGRGIDGAGEGERLDEKDERLLWLITLGGFIGRAIEVGVPGAEGTGEPTAASTER